MQNLKVGKNNHLLTVREDTKIGCYHFVIEDGPRAISSKIRVSQSLCTWTNYER